jgi:hypothetical protein
MALIILIPAGYAASRRAARPGGHGHVPGVADDNDAERDFRRRLTTEMMKT